MILRIECKVCALGNDAPYKFVVILRSPFLVWGRRVTVKQAGPAVPLAVKLNPGWIGKFTSVISQDNRKELHEDIRSQFQIKTVKDIDDRLGIVGIPEESQHQGGVYKVYRKEDFSTLYPFNRINLYNRGIRVKGDIFAIVLPGTADAAGFIHFQGNRLYLAWAEPDFAWQVDVTSTPTTEVSTQVTPQVSTQVKLEPNRLASLLDFCSVPRSRREMQDFCGIKTTEYFRKNIIKPMLNENLIKPTIPDKPNSRLQKYIKA